MSNVSVKSIKMKFVNKNAAEWFGWYGAIAIIAAYILVSADVIPAKGFWFHFLNASGGLGVALISLQKKAYQPMTINVFRALTGVIALGSIFIFAK